MSTKEILKDAAGMAGLSALIYGAFLFGPSLAQPICGPRSEIVGQLSDQWGEQRRATALTTPDQMIEVYVSPRTGTWTIPNTIAGGPTCVVAAGEGWSEQPIGEPS